MERDAEAPREKRLRCIALRRTWGNKLLLSRAHSASRAGEQLPAPGGKRSNQAPNYVHQSFALLMLLYFSGYIGFPWLTVIKRQ